jgi:hypothetical protein
MRFRVVAALLLAILVLSACGSPSTSASPSASASLIPVTGGGSGGPSPGPGGVGGGSDGRVTRTWSETVEEAGSGVRSVIHQQYQATVSINLTEVDVGAWAITGRAQITSSFTSLYESRTTTPLGPCNIRYTDDASAGGAVDVEGGLEARDGFYQFHVNIPGLDGTNRTVRDDSGCNGPNNQETTPWTVAPILAAGNGDLTDPGHISGSFTEPRQGGEDTVSWDITLPD